jgi:hypothetical protein
MAEAESGGEISADTVSTFLCPSGECNVNKDKRKCVKIGSGTKNNNGLSEVFQVMKKHVETSSDHAGWRW